MPSPDPTPRRRRLRRWRLAALAVAGGLALAVAAVPWVLATPPARRWLLAQANRTLHPGRLHFDAFEPSWFGPARLAGVALYDHQGELVVAAPRASWDRTLGQILFDGPRLGTLDLRDATLDLDRRVDGSVDLLETLGPILGRDPDADLAVRIEGGRLRYRDPALAGPVEASRVDLALAIPAVPAPLTWDLALSGDADDGLDTPRLAIRGRLGRGDESAGPPPDLETTFEGRRWPIAAEAGGAVARGRFDGDARIARRGGRWASRGDAAIVGLLASGPTLAGDRPEFARIAGAWDVSEDDRGWTVRRAEFDSPLGSLRAEGTWPAPDGEAARISGSVDLAALAGSFPATLRLREGLAVERGRAAIELEARPGEEPGEHAWSGSARLDDLLARDGDRRFVLGEPATLGLRATSRPDGFRVERLSARTSFLDALAEGDADRGVVLAGSLDLAAFRERLGDLVDLGDLDLAGRAGLSGTYRREGDRFEGRLRVDLRGLRVAKREGNLFDREEAGLALAVNGPADPGGLPAGWSQASVSLSSGHWEGEAVALADANSTAFDARMAGPWAVAGREHFAEASLAAVWDGSALAIESARLAATTADGPPLELTSQGLFDPASGELQLDHPGQIPGAALALGPRGLRAAGIGGSEGWAVEADLVGDAPALARLLAAEDEAPGLLGTWTARLVARGGLGETDLGGRVEFHPDAGEEEAGPYRLTWQARHVAAADRVELPELVLSGPFATFEASGRLTDWGGRRVADLRGSLVPDWDRINAWLVERDGPDARVSGRGRAFRLTGPLAGESLDDVLAGLEGEAGFDLEAARLFGLDLGPAALVVQARSGRVGLAPIDTTLNEGRLRVEAELDLDRDRGPAVRLLPGSSLDDARINDEVSRRFLAFAAPVLADATRVRGRVSASIRDAEFPLGEAPRRGARVEGNVAFHDVEFAAGPLADEVLSLVAPERQPRLRLDEPVYLNIADGRVHQRGLSIPLGGVTRVEVEGWVDFDRRMALNVGLPVTPALLANNPLLVDIASGTRVTVPVGGTLSAPQVDREALADAMLDLGKTLLRRGAARGAAELLFRLSRPREVDPDAPPRLTPEERRLQRQENREERRRRRSGEP